MRRPMKLLKSIYQQIKSKPSLFILLAILVSIIVILSLIPRQHSPTHEPTPPPTSTTNQSIQTINSIEPFKTTKLNLSGSGQLLAIDQKNSHLISITPDKTTTLYPSSVKNFSQKDNLIALIETTDRQSLIILDLDTNSTQTFNLNSISPLIDLSFDPHSSDLYLLANLDTIKRTTNLYKLNLDNPQPVYISSTKATNLKILSQQNILLFAYADGQDLSTVSIYNLPSSQTTFSAKANSYLISPNLNSITAISSKSATTFNLNDSSQKYLDAPHILGGYWASNTELVLLKNTPEGVNQAPITPLTTTPKFNLITKLKDKTLRSIIGYLDGHLYAIDYFGQIVIIPL